MTKKTKILISAVSLFIVFAVSAATTVALLSAQPDGIVKTVTPGVIEVSGNAETDNGEVKSYANNICATNNGNVDAYIRVKLAIAYNDILPSTVLGTRIIGNGVFGENVVFNEEDIDNPNTAEVEGPWLMGSDGFCYYRTPVPAGESTVNLIESYNADNGVHVDIITQSIQAQGAMDDGTLAVEDAWGVTVDENGNLEVQYEII